VVVFCGLLSAIHGEMSLYLSDDRKAKDLAVSALKNPSFVTAEVARFIHAHDKKHSFSFISLFFSHFF
jgi:hypothetical protein